MKRFVWTGLLYLTLGSAPVASALQAQSRVIHSSISQVASGGGWKTTLTLLNLSSTRNSVTVTFMGGNGLPLVLPLVIRQEGAAQVRLSSQVVQVVRPLGTLVIESEAPLLSQTLAGWADIASSRPLAGIAIFRQRDQDGRDTEGTAPLETTPLPGLILPFDNTKESSTGVAIVNMSTDRVLISALVRDEDGIEVNWYAVALLPRGHTAFIGGDRFPSSIGRRGSIEFRNIGERAVTGLGFRFSTSASHRYRPCRLRPDKAPEPRRVELAL